MQLKNSANQPTNVSDSKANVSVVEKAKVNTPVVEAVVKAANSAVNGNAKNANKVAALLKNRNVINAAKKLVEELNHSAPSAPSSPLGASPVPSAPLGASPEDPTANTQKGGLRKTRSKAKKTRSTRRR